MAFSTFDAAVPANALFGRTTAAGQRVLCTNPAALGGGSGLGDVIYPTQPFAPRNPLAIGIKLLGITFPTARTIWISSPGSYRAQCSSAGGANVLQVTALRGAPTAKASPDPTWGLHLMDANIALGNQVEVMRPCAVVDLDAPLLLAQDRVPGLRYDGSTLYPPEPALWG